MARRAPSIVGGYTHYVLNRGNGQLRLFGKAGDFVAFERVIEEALARVPEPAAITLMLLDAVLAAINRGLAPCG